MVGQGHGRQAGRQAGRRSQRPARMIEAAIDHGSGRAGQAATVGHGHGSGRPWSGRAMAKAGQGHGR